MDWPDKWVRAPAWRAGAVSRTPRAGSWLVPCDVRTAPFAERAARRSLRGVLVLAVATAAAGALAGCSAGYGSSSQRYPTGTPYPAAVSHPTAAEQAATLRATEGYRRLLLTNAERLSSLLGTLSRDAGSGRLAAAQRDELAAQDAYDVLRADVATDSATADQLDGERWSVGASPFGGLHAIEAALWGHGACPVAHRLATALELQALLAGFVFYRMILTPDHILADAQSQLAWTVGVAVAGREEQFSHHDLVDVVSAVGAARSAFELVAPLGRLVATTTTAAVAARFAALGRVLSGLGPPASVVDNAIPASTWRAIATDTDAINAPLGDLSGLVAGFGSGRTYA